MTIMWISPAVLERLAGSLLHFVWQGAAIAIVAAVALRLLRRRSPESRYAAAAAALLAMMAAPLVTFVFYAETGALTLRLLRGLNSAATMAASEATAGGVAEWTERIVFVWMIGVGVFLTRLIGGWLLSRRLARSAAAVVTPLVRETFARARAGLNFHGKVRLLCGERIETPVVIGWLRPAILLPSSALTLNADYLLAILAHELAHIRRHDFLVNGIQRAVECVLFYHPAVWWISGRIRVERERCCDDLAVRVCSDRLVYAQALVALEKARPAAALLALPTAGAGVADRVRRILGLRSANRDWQSAAAALVFAAILVGAGTLQPATLAEPAIPLIAPAQPSALMTPPALEAAETPAPAAPLSAILAIATAKGVPPLPPAEVPPPQRAPQVTQPPITPSRQAAREKLGLLRVDYSADSFVKQAAEGDTIAVKTFLDAGMEIDSRDAAGFTALIKAAQMRKAETVQSLLAAGANPNLTVTILEPAGTQSSALSLAAGNGDLATMKVLLAGRATVDLKITSRYNEQTALMVAAEGGHRDAVILLLDNKASIEAGKTSPFLTAACKSRFDVARILVERGADINAKGSNTALNCGASGLDIEFVRFLLDRGADINAKNSSGISPLLSLPGLLSDVGAGKANAIALLLIDRGADVNVVSSDGKTPLTWATSAQRTEVVRALLAKGADPNPRDSRPGNLPLTMALTAARTKPEGNVDIALLLIDGGADVNAMGLCTTCVGPPRGGGAPGRGGAAPSQTTPLILAIEAKQTEVIRKLLAKGANPNTPRSDGATPLRAAELASAEIRQLLINAGAKQ